MVGSRRVLASDGKTAIVGPSCTAGIGFRVQGLAKFIDTLVTMNPAGARCEALEESFREIG